jgi:hypothetical protein
MKIISRAFVICIAFIVLTPWLSFADSQATISLYKGQKVYVPVYSHIYAGNRKMQILLTVTLSIRNTDPQHPIMITTVDYYGTKGELLNKFLNKPIVLGPLESTHYIIPRDDKSGGSGANFLVEWSSEKPINQPIVESVMIGADGQQGISFTSRGQAITVSE